MVRLRVRELAEALGWNIQILAEKTGLAYSSAVDLWHDRVQRIDKKTLSRVSKALGVRPGELFTDDEEHSDEKNVEPALAA